METIELASIKNELMAIISRTEDKKLLEKMMEIAKQPIVNDDDSMTKEEILSDFDDACKELKLYMDGKIKLQSAEDFLNEL